MRKILAAALLALATLSGCEECWARPELEVRCASGDAAACQAMHSCGG